MLLLLSLSACGDYVAPAQPLSAGETSGELVAGRSIGQTFVAHHDGLCGVDVLLATCARANTQPVVFHLRSSPEEEVDLRTVTILATDVNDNTYHHFDFAPIRDSNGQRFHFSLESPTSSPGDAITAWLGSWESYQDGSANEDSQPVQAQMVFRLHYAPVWVTLGALETLLDTGLDLLPSLLIVFLPGLALSVTLLRPRTFEWREQLALAPAIGVALYPVILAWCHLFGVRPGASLVWVALGLSGIALLLCIWRSKPGPSWTRVKSALRAWWKSDSVYCDLTTCAVLGLILIALLVPIRQFVAPLWDDSVQHAVMAQRIFEDGGIFDSWEPYAPYTGMTTHFGFATIVAATMWLTGKAVAPTMLLVGQTMNLVGALALYGLVVHISRNRWAGIGTLITVSLFSIVPASYTNWGRYPQLTGQAVLPAAVCLLWAVGELRRFRAGLVILAGLAAAGMTLSYYRTPYLYALFAGAWLIIQIMPAWLGKKLEWRRGLIWLGSVAVVLLVLVAPWVWLGFVRFGQVSAANAAAATELAVNGPQSQGQLQSFAAPWALFRPWWEHPGYRWLFLGALAAGLTALFLRRRRVLVLAGWLVGFLLLPLVPPFSGNDSTLFSTMIAIYIPAGLLTGWLCGTLVGALMNHAPKLMRLFLVLAALGIASHGTSQMLHILDPAFALVTQADLDAMEWISQNTPVDAKFLINGLVYTDGRSVVGGDAGWWLPLLAHRANSIPPQYALFTATPSDPGYTQRVYHLVHTLLAHSPTSAQGMQELCDFGITHVYIGQRQGMTVAALPISIWPEKPMLDQDELASSPSFELLYAHDRVRIFRFDRGTCSD